MNGSMLDEHPTGVGIYSINIINQLSDLYKAEQKSDFTVFTPTKTFLQDNVNTIRIPGILKSSKYGRMAALSRLIWNAFCYPFKVRDFDLLLSPTTHGSFLSTNQVITIHDLISLRYNNISFHQRIYFKYLLPLLVSRAKLIITVSETSKRDIVQFLKYPQEKIKVVPNGYDNSRYFFTPFNNKNIIGLKYNVGKYFLAIGPTYPHKNFELLIDAYQSLDDELKKEYKLLIAGGKAAYLDKLKKKVSALQLNDNIRFIGYVPAALMPALYREAYALVFPSLYEGFGIPLLEAMASGCPVISSDTSSMPEVCGDAAMYFDPLNQAALTTAITRMINDEVLYADLRKKGLLQAMKFSWMHSAQRLKTIIENIHN